jgi:hypothetical protein
MPGTPPSEPIDITSTEAADTAAALNTAGHFDAYGNAWTGTTVDAGHANTDANQRKRLIKILALVALAAG